MCKSHSSGASWQTGKATEVAHRVKEVNVGQYCRLLEQQRQQKDFFDLTGTKPSIAHAHTHINTHTLNTTARINSILLILSKCHYVTLTISDSDCPWLLANHHHSSEKGEAIIISSQEWAKMLVWECACLKHNAFRLQLQQIKLPKDIFITGGKRSSSSAPLLMFLTSVSTCFNCFSICFRFFCSISVDTANVPFTGHMTVLECDVICGWGHSDSDKKDLTINQIFL